IPNAFVPRSLSRVLDTSRFFTPVKMVRAYRTSSGARIAINLRGNPEYSVSQSDDGFLFVDIVIPESMRQEQESARQTSVSVSPEGPEEGISHAYQSEILIGEQGRTTNPQAVFGTGSGSANPAAQLGMSAGFMFDQTSSSNSSFTGRPISIDLVNADIHHIFRLFNSVSNLNIVAGDDVSGTVSVTLKEVPWDQAMAAILQAKGLGSQRFGNIIRVAPIETIKAEQQAALETKRSQEELKELQLLVIPLNYAQASELESQISELLSARGTLQVDTRGNQLIIKETEERLAQIRELIRHLDKATPQVMIEARVVEAKSNYANMFGIQWGSQVNASTSTGYSTGLFFPNDVGISGGRTTGGADTFYAQGQDTLMVDLGADASTSSMAFSLGSIPGLIDLDARLSAMESDGWGKVVSEPRITTLDNQQAMIQQGSQIPFLSTSSGGTQVQFVDATLKMSVLPHITSENSISMVLDIAHNRPDFSKLVQGQPGISIKEATTTVLVGDGDTTVIGGVFYSDRAYSEEFTPGLHKIPILGYLFKNKSDVMERNEMLVFVTPHIITRTTTATAAQ
ncbi:MAG: type IV pilus secretin PilQ, partial [Myxococcota bacterium]|nr:type IV pilus secretin PilQ [Myxococcota bacterium]